MPKKCTIIYNPIPDFPDYFAASNGKIYSVKQNKGDADKFNTTLQRTYRIYPAGF